jgi:AraC-like DNA-binding protein
MKPFLEDINSHQKKVGFYAYRFQIPFFEFKWHYHPEIELTYIVKGNGYRLIGDSHDTFKEGDLVLLGSCLPHTWVGKSNTDENFEAIVIQFPIEMIASFIEIEEGKSLKILFELSKKGLFFPSVDQKLQYNLEKIFLSDGFNRVLNVLEILHQLTQSDSVVLCANDFQTVNSLESENRINVVCSFLENHYAEALSLKQVADLIHLTESNFCNFFKKATGKTFSDYLNSIRITRSCQLLLQTDKPINVISFECGYETLNYFNRIFKKKKGMTPKQFRNKKD